MLGLGSLHMKSRKIYQFEILCHVENMQMDDGTFSQLFAFVRDNTSKSNDVGSCVVKERAHPPLHREISAGGSVKVILD